MKNTQYIQYSGTVGLFLQTTDTSLKGEKYAEFLKEKQAICMNNIRARQCSMPLFQKS